MTTYPEQEHLDKIQNWNPFELKEDFRSIKDAYEGMMSFIEDLWEYNGFTKIEDKDGSLHYILHTYGWSGNEDIIGSLAGNNMFWLSCFESKFSGGHYHFIIK